MLLVDGGIEGLGVSGVAREALVAVRDVKATVGSTLHGTEDAGASSGVLNTNVEKGTEGLLLVIELLDVVGAAVGTLSGDDITSGLLNTGVDLIEADLLEEAASAEKTSAVSSSVVLESDLQAISGELLGGGLAEDLIAIDLGVDDLDENVAVGEADNKTVLGGLVLVLVLSDELVALAVVSAALYGRRNSQETILSNNCMYNLIKM